MSFHNKVFSRYMDCMVVKETNIEKDKVRKLSVYMKQEVNSAQPFLLKPYDLF